MLPLSKTETDQIDETARHPQLVRATPIAGHLALAAAIGVGEYNAPPTSYLVQDLVQLSQVAVTNLHIPYGIGEYINQPKVGEVCLTDTTTDNLAAASLSPAYQRAVR